MIWTALYLSNLKLLIFVCVMQIEYPFSILKFSHCIQLMYLFILHCHSHFKCNIIIYLLGVWRSGIPGGSAGSGWGGVEARAAAQGARLVLYSKWPKKGNGLTFHLSQTWFLHKCCQMFFSHLSNIFFHINVNPSDKVWNQVKKLFMLNMEDLYIPLCLDRPRLRAVAELTVLIRWMHRQFRYKF